MKKVVIGSRNSPLALLQSELVISLLQRAAPHYKYSIRKIRTQGDKIIDVPLAKIGDKGLFVKEINSALLKGEIDLAVHSMKDVPTKLERGLTINAMTEREDPRDVLIPGPNICQAKLVDLPGGTVLGTSSLRRRAQILHYRPDLEVFPVRGNLNTRMEKLRQGKVAALVLAYAGIKRMGWESYISEVIPAEVLLPAVGQGALGMEIREDAPEMAALVEILNDGETHACITAERAFLRTLEGGCQVPIGALGEIRGEKLRLRGLVSSLGGTMVLQGEKEGPVSEPQKIGIALAEDLLLQGARSLLTKARQEFDADE